MTPAEERTTNDLLLLMVYEDVALIRTLTTILRLNGFETQAASTARAGLELASRSDVTLAVMDLRPADMDVMESIARLREISELTEVVVLTGSAPDESAVAALRDHGIDYLIGPVPGE